jgi:maleate isomerase
MNRNQLRVGMIVPSLNTIAEDDFRLFCPSEVPYHVHRIRLRKEGGRVTVESLARAHLEATEEAGYLKDMGPGVIVFNCTGASVSYGPGCDVRLAERMTRELGVPATNTMVAIKNALAAVGARRVVHVCPFADEFSSDERRSLEEGGVTVLKSVGLNFTDAREAALMDPAKIVEIAKSHAQPGMEGILLSCANVRAFEAAEQLEDALGVPVVTSNQAVLWEVLRLLKWQGAIPGAGRLFRTL